MKSNIPEAHKYVAPTDIAEREGLYHQLVDIITPFAETMLIEAQTAECAARFEAVPFETDQRILGHHAGLVADSMATSLLVAYQAVGTLENGSDLLPVSGAAREIFFGRLSNIGYTREQLTGVLSRYAATLPEPQLPECLVKLFALVKPQA